MTTLNEICQCIADGDHQAPPKSDSGVPFVTISCFDPNGGAIDYSGTACVPREYYESLPDKRRAKAGDVLLSVVGSLGIPYLVKEGDEFVFQRHIAILRPGSDVLSKYLYYLLKSKDVFHIIDSIAQGAAQRTLTLTQLRGLEVEVPNVSKQEKVVAILSAYDDLIDNSRRQIKLLEEAAQRLYREWFVHLRFPGYENVEIVDGLPESWKIVAIQDVCNVVGGGTPSTKVPTYYEDGTIPWVTPTDVTGNAGIFLPSPAKCITEEGLNNSAAKLLPPFTILMTSRASIGYFCICDKAVATNQGFISCVPEQDRIRWYLLCNLMNRTHEMKSLAGGSTFLEIGRGKFKTMPLVRPSDSILDRFDKAMKPVIDEQIALRKQICLLSEARDRLLPKLMSGEIEV